MCGLNHPNIHNHAVLMGSRSGTFGNTKHQADGAFRSVHGSKFASSVADYNKRSTLEVFRARKAFHSLGSAEWYSSNRLISRARRLLLRWTAPVKLASRQLLNELDLSELQLRIVESNDGYT